MCANANFAESKNESESGNEYKRTKLKMGEIENTNEKSSNALRCECVRENVKPAKESIQLAQTHAFNFSTISANRICFVSF